jgi:hypothetical protein
VSQIHLPITVSVQTADDLTGLGIWTIKEACDAGTIESHFTDDGVRLVNTSSLALYVGNLSTERPGGAA